MQKSHSSQKLIHRYAHHKKPIKNYFIPYPNRTCSVHSSVRSTSVRRNYGLGTEQVRLGYGVGGYLTNNISEQEDFHLYNLDSYKHVSSRCTWQV